MTSKTGKQNTMKDESARESSDSSKLSCVSMKSNWSMDVTANFKNKESSAETRCQKRPSKFINSDQLEAIFKELEQKVISLVKNTIKRFKKTLSPDNPICTEREMEDEDQISVREGALKITLHILRGMNQTDLANTLQTYFAPPCHEKLKSKFRRKLKNITEGISMEGSSALLNEIYTELYITEGGSRVVSEHEVRQIETAQRKMTTQETAIKCNEIFNPSLGQDKAIRTVLTNGVAGIGKTVSVQKFILDWAEGEANQDVHFIFPLPFRELNMMKGKMFSLIELIHCFFKEQQELSSRDYSYYRVMFIFDGLDECRLPLDFQNNESLFDVTQSASVDVLLTNLIKGNLLPSALIWITTRPAAASQIPPDCVDQVTEVRGFSDPQKEEYFRKRISDKKLADKIITHIKSSRSLYIMCHIPVFCWIAATVLQRMLTEADSGEIPKTLTQMFTHFLVFQIKHKSQKYHRKSEIDSDQTRKTVLALGKLAFQQLEKGNLIFYEQDLRECDIDMKEVSVYSGVCTQIFREEFGLHLGKVFSFVHLSVQEFLAALYAFISFTSNKTNVLVQHESGLFKNSKKPTMSDFLKSAVDKALQCENGHLDLFLRFLLGLSLESNQSLLQALLTQAESCKLSNDETLKYIKKMIEMYPSAEKSINLFHCLNELNDHSLVQEVQTYVQKGIFKLSNIQWSALMFVLLNSEEELEEFDLNKYGRSHECLMRLLPVVRASRKVGLERCRITKEGCAALTSSLISNPSHLRELNLNYSKLGDSGVKLLSDLLKDPHCKLEKLQLQSCSIAEEGCAALTSALISNPSHLRELNLNYSKPGDSGVKLLSDLLKDPYLKLEKLQLEHCSFTEEGCAALTSALISNPSHLRELNLNRNKPGDSGVKLLSDLLKDPHCKLKKLQLEFCTITEEGCGTLTTALMSNPSHLRELNLNYNKPGDSGVKWLSDLLNDPRCKMENLQLEHCSITEEGCTALTSSLISNPSHLRELNLNYNKAGDSGVKLLSDLLKNPHCKLEKLQLEHCNITEEGCAALTSALISNPLHISALNLGYNKPGDSGVKLLCDLLKDPHCKLQKLQLEHCSITQKNSAALISSLISNPSHLQELNLNNNKAEDSGMKLLSGLLKDPHCKLEKLQLERCSITEEGCTALTSALISNPSHLRELNLNYNKPGDSSVKLLSDLLKDPHCKLEKLQLEHCSITEEGCAALTSALISNPSHLRELNLSYNEPGDSGVKLLSDLLKDPHCKLEKLQYMLKNFVLCWCILTDKSCAVLASALSSNSTSLRALELSGNELEDSGVKLLSAGLKIPNCTLEILRLEHCSITEEGFVALCSALKSNPSHLRELNLNWNEPGDSGVKLLSDLLKDPHCKLDTVLYN